jgi:Uma2 family endonuclease
MSLTVDLGEDLASGSALLRLPRNSEESFIELCERNPDLRVERTADGDVILMAPADSWTESRGSELLIDLGLWNRGLARPGLVFGSSAGFRLPNGAQRSPDASWIARVRWDAVPADQRTHFAQITPDFVVEVMSPSDRLNDAIAKMEEYRDNGVHLGWLIDRRRRTVIVYRPGHPVETLLNPSRLAGDPELPGFVADLANVFREDIAMPRGNENPDADPA